MSNDTKHSGPVDVREILDRRAAEAAFLGRDIAALELRDVMAAVAELIAASRDAAAVLQDKAGPLEQETPRRLYAALAKIGSAS